MCRGAPFDKFAPPSTVTGLGLPFELPVVGECRAFPRIRVSERRVTRGMPGCPAEVRSGIAPRQENRRCGLDADSRHLHQDLGTREVIYKFDVAGQEGALVFEFPDVLRDAREMTSSTASVPITATSARPVPKVRLDKVHRVIAPVIPGAAQRIGSPGGPQAGGPIAVPRDRTERVDSRKKSASASPPGSGT